jgi:U11/U12 small nuclear ribonucleoprotein SNRNP65
VVHESVGLKPASLVPKEIPIIKKKNTVLQVIFCLIDIVVGLSDYSYRYSCYSIVSLQIKIAPKVTHNEYKEDSIMTESEDPDTEGSDQKHYATAEEIESKRLAPEEILSLPKFKVPSL